MTTAEQRIAALSPEQRELLLRRLRDRTPATAAAAPPELPRIPEVADRLAPVPLTDVQETFWIGRSGLFDLGGCGANVYIENEFRGIVWPFSEELNTVLRRVIERQEILRTIVHPDGTQQVLAEVPPFEVEVGDLSSRTAEEIEEHLGRVREELRYARRPVDRWPLFQIVLHQIHDGMIRLHARFDAMLIDGTGRNVLIHELATFLAMPQSELPAPEVTFLDYARALAEFRDTATWQKARDYWLERVPQLPPAPLLPVVRDIGPEMVPRVVKREVSLLDPAAWAALKQRAGNGGLSPTCAITTAFAEALRPWSESASFTLGFGGSYRPQIHPQIEQTIGTFTTVHLLAVEDAGASFLERARLLQRRITTDIDHQQFSGLRVLRERNRLHRAGGRATMPIQFNSVVEHGDTAPTPTDEQETAALAAMAEEIDADAASAANAANAIGAAEPVVDGEAAETAEAPPEPAPAPRRPPFILQVTDKDLLISLPQVLLLAVALRNAEGGLDLVTQVVEEVFPAGLVPALLDVYRKVLERLAAEDEAWQEERPARRALPPLTLAHALLEHREPAPAPSLGSLFTAAAQRSPGAPALISADSNLSFGELHRRALSLAASLQDLGLAPGAPVAVVIERGHSEMVTAALGTALAGATWVPLDASLHPDLLHRRIAAAGARAILLRAELDALPGWPADLPRIAVDRLGESDGAAPFVLDAPAGPAAIFFAEGEDTPAVPLAAETAVAAVTELAAHCELAPGDRFLALSPPDSDLLLFDLFGALGAGATVVLPLPGTEREPARLRTLMERQKVTVWSAPATLLEAVIDSVERDRRAKISDLRLVLFQRESVPAALLGRLEALRPGIRFAAAWGSPALPIAAAAGPLPPEGSPCLSFLPQPIAGRSLHVLDDAGDPRPDGVPGELWIGEPAADGVRLVAAGQRACREPDGLLTLLGPGADPEIPALGYRVDLRRVEGVLRRHPGLRHAAVAWQADGDGGGRLVAWILPRVGQPYDDDALRTFVRGELPAHLVPDIYVRLASFPMTSDGRLDRAALTIPAAVPPPPLDRDPIASALADLWQETIGRRPTSVRDDFFALGGDSLAAVRLLSRIRERWGDAIAAGDLLARPTPEGMAAVIQRATAHSGRLARLGAWLRGDRRYVGAAAAREPDAARRSASYGMRMYLIIFVGNFISNIGTGLGQFALMVWIYRQTNSVSQFSIMLTLASITALVTMPFGGSIADRFDRKKILIWSNAASIVMTLFIASALYTHSLRVWHSYIIAVIMNAIGNLSGPAAIAVIPQLVSRRQLVRMAGFSSTIGSLTGMGMPLLAGFLVQKISYHGVIFVDAFTFLFAIASIATVRIPRLPISQHARSSMLGDLAFGWRFMRRQRGLFQLLLMFALTNLSAGVVGVLLGPLILSFASPLELGKVNAAATAGGVLGAFTLSIWGGPKRRVWGIFFGLIIQACLLFLGGLQPNVALVSFALCIAMFTAPIVGGCNQGIWQANVPLDVQGRVMSARGTLGLAIMPLSFMMAGPLSDKVFGPMLMPGGLLAGSVGRIIGVGPGRGVGFLFILLGIFMITVVSLAFLNPRLRNVEDEAPVAERPTFGGGQAPAAAA